MAVYFFPSSFLFLSFFFLFVLLTEFPSFSLNLIIAGAITLQSISTASICATFCEYLDGLTRIYILYRYFIDPFCLARQLLKSRRNPIFYFKLYCSTFKCTLRRLSDSYLFTIAQTVLRSSHLLSFRTFPST